VKSIFSLELVHALPKKEIIVKIAQELEVEEKAVTAFFLDTKPHNNIPKFINHFPNKSPSLIKHMKLHPGEVEPSPLQLENLLNYFSLLFNDSLQEREKNFLASLIIETYKDIKGVFPNKKDFIEKIKYEGKFKNNETLIQILVENELNIDRIFTKSSKLEKVNIIHYIQKVNKALTENKDGILIDIPRKRDDKDNEKIKELKVNLEKEGHTVFLQVDSISIKFKKSFSDNIKSKFFTKEDKAIFSPYENLNKTLDNKGFKLGTKIIINKHLGYLLDFLNYALEEGFSLYINSDDFSVPVIEEWIKENYQKPYINPIDNKVDIYVNLSPYVNDIQAENRDKSFLIQSRLNIKYTDHQEIDLNSKFLIHCSPEAIEELYIIKRNGEVITPTSSNNKIRIEKKQEHKLYGFINTEWQTIQKFPIRDFTQPQFNSFISGGTGTGKSVLAKKMIQESLENEESSSKIIVTQETCKEYDPLIDKYSGNYISFKGTDLISHIGKYRDYKYQEVLEYLSKLNILSSEQEIYLRATVSKISQGYFSTYDTVQLIRTINEIEKFHGIDLEKFRDNNISENYLRMLERLLEHEISFIETEDMLKFSQLIKSFFEETTSSDSHGFLNYIKDNIAEEEYKKHKSSLECINKGFQFPENIEKTASLNLIKVPKDLSQFSYNITNLELLLLVGEKDHRRFDIVFDEPTSYHINQDYFMIILIEFLRTARKMGTAIMFIAQHWTNLFPMSNYSKEQEQAILANFSRHIIFKQSRHNYINGQKSDFFLDFNIKEEDHHLFEDLNFGEFVCIGSPNCDEDNIKKYQLRLSEKDRILLTLKYLPIFQYYKDTNSSYSIEYIIESIEEKFFLKDLILVNYLKKEGHNYILREEAQGQAEMIFNKLSTMDKEEAISYIKNKLLE